MTKVTEDNIKEKLKYIGLDLRNIPDFLKTYKDLEYRPLKAYEENTYKVYKYIPISKIQILLTPKNRLNTIKEKYSNASSIYKYLKSESEEEIVKHTTFLKMLKDTKIEQIQQIEEEQKLLNKEIPFKVRFRENYSWQIYYSDTTNMYFMMVPTEDLEYETFFYLLKEQIKYHKTKKEKMIFAPICYENYSEGLLRRTEISDIEKYLWFFTKNLPNVYEVYDKKENLSIEIVGDVVVYDDIVSPYRVKLKDKEEAVKFYKLLKALFILGTELSHHYKFKVKLNRFGSLEFEYDGKKIAYDNMFNMLNESYVKAKEEILKLGVENINLKRKLELLKRTSSKKNEEYIIKEKQIATYLECKKTFFGRVKYFFRAKKLKKQIPILENSDEETEKKETKQEEKTFQNKEYYTIEDISKIYKELDEQEEIAKNLKLDISALKNKIENMEKKIENANLYIAEIDKHEKNIFEFWRFTNKDESKLLNEGTGEVINVQKKIEKVYKYKEDLETIGNIVDKNQREKFNKNELDSIYLLTTNVIDAISNIEDENIVAKNLEELKQEAENERILFSTEKIDIFGNIAEDNRTTKILGTKKHRESAKDKIKILDINKDTTLEEYTKRLKEMLKQINKCIDASNSKVAINVYIASKEELNLKGLHTFYIDPNEALEQYKDEKEIKLYKIHLEENSKVIYFSNSVYYDNYNKTLPLGMNIGTKGIIDINRYKLENICKDDFRIIEMLDEFNIKIQKVDTYEYKILEGKNDK